ncbi:MAG: hypothetical protein U0572_00105 [Phycisphaerales bacterium]
MQLESFIARGAHLRRAFYAAAAIGLTMTGAACTHLEPREVLFTHSGRNGWVQDYRPEGDGNMTLWVIAVPDEKTAEDFAKLVNTHADGNIWPALEPGAAPQPESVNTEIAEDTARYRPLKVDFKPDPKSELTTLTILPKSGGQWTSWETPVDGKELLWIAVYLPFDKTAQMWADAASRKAQWWVAFPSDNNDPRNPVRLIVNKSGIHLEP